MAATKQYSLKDVFSNYYDAGGFSGLGSYLKTNNPHFLIKIWVWISIWIILPQVTVAHLYTALLTSIPMATRFLSMSLGLDQFQITIKTHYFLGNIKRFRNIMLDFESYHCVQHLGIEAVSTMMKVCRLIKWLRNTYNFACYFTFFAWTLFPIVATPKALFFGIETGSMMKVLPPDYPFLTDYFPMVQLIYSLESLSTFVILTFFASTNLIFVTDILLISQLFKVLNQSVSPRNAVGPMSLRLFVIDHQRLLKISSDIRALLSPVLALQLGVSVMTITLAVFEITMVNQTSSSDSELNHIVLMSRKTSYTLIIFVELLLYCWLSTELELSCTSVRDGIYNSLWYRKPSKGNRDILLVQMRALKPVKLTAMGIATLKLGTSLEVLRMAYSYYTYLKRLH